jgi:DNA polymerase-3 subunit gamma/tau
LNPEFRPTKPDELFGQNHLISLLKNWLIDTKLIPSSLLLVGSYGCGKTSVARMLAKRLITIPSDLVEINAANSRGIDDVREWADGAKFKPLGKNRVYILDELHQLTAAAQKALLKVVEEPPAGIYYFFCTTEKHRLIPELTSRCHELVFYPLDMATSIELCTFLTEGQMPFSKAKEIAQYANGHARDLVKATTLWRQDPSWGPSSNATAGFNNEPILLLKNEFLQAYALGDTNQLTENLTKFCSHPEINQVCSMLDTALDQLCKTDNNIRANYLDLLSLRKDRKAFLINSTEYLVGVFSVMLRR